MDVRDDRLPQHPSVALRSIIPPFHRSIQEQAADPRNGAVQFVSYTSRQHAEHISYYQQLMPIGNNTPSRTLSLTIYAPTSAMSLLDSQLEKPSLSHPHSNKGENETKNVEKKANNPIPYARRKILLGLPQYASYRRLAGGLVGY